MGGSRLCSTTVGRRNHSWACSAKGHASAVGSTAAGAMAEQEHEVEITFKAVTRLPDGSFSDEENMRTEIGGSFYPISTPLSTIQGDLEGIARENGMVLRCCAIQARDDVFAVATVSALRSARSLLAPPVAFTKISCLLAVCARSSTRSSTSIGAQDSRHLQLRGPADRRYRILWRSWRP